MASIDDNKDIDNKLSDINDHHHSDGKSETIKDENNSSSHCKMLRISSSNGIASIKSEYIINQIKSFDEQYLCKNNDNKKRDNNDDNESSSKKKRFRGQNKNRRNQMFRESKKSRSGNEINLCHKFASDGVCDYGDKCVHSHDLDKFASNRLPDIGNECYSFKTFGKCPYGILCRFGNGHLNGTKNIIDNDKIQQLSSSPRTFNTLTKEIQISLRKKLYDFSHANNAINDILKIPYEQLKSKSLSTTQKNRKCVDFSGKLYLAPLTTVGNLPFRRICKEYGADITCGEMAMCTHLLDGQQSEWALLRRHHTEDIFGVQICGSHSDSMTRCAQLINDNCNVDFIDINMGCPIDMVYQKGAGSGLMDKRKKLQEIVYGMTSVMNIPLTMKMRTGVYVNKNIAKKVISTVKEWTPQRVDLITVHGRSREQRYTKHADWNYIDECASDAHPIPLFGSGDVLSHEEYYQMIDNTNVSGIMIARGALIKPWIFTEIKEKRHWDISANERFELLKRYVNYGLEHWGSDTCGVMKTRRFMLEWLSFLYRYIPVGLLETLPQKINERPLTYRGRSELETLFSSASCADWVKITEMLLGPVPDDFVFIPKHKANAYTV